MPVCRQNFKTLYQRQTGIDHDRELSREDRELLGLHAATESGHAEFLALFGHFRGGDLLSPQQGRPPRICRRAYFFACAGGPGAGSFGFLFPALIFSPPPSFPWRLVFFAKSTRPAVA